MGVEAARKGGGGCVGNEDDGPATEYIDCGSSSSGNNGAEGGMPC
jgi:hypothetical protein